ncbi:putative ATP-dependent RNA helicase DDX10 [Frankliniella fusca]|uniref:ATP-dependent RNA helicase n=1 Tax=Frankliniella fusca TaxID=407009 RepID=A0AAE1I1G9_9NEOP|nr:putative ATP-dependent RNA helicase DDX10 [Frankliniella fusca]
MGQQQKTSDVRSKKPPKQHKNGQKAKKKVKVWAGKKKGEREEVIIEKLKSQYKKINVNKIKNFDDFPLSKATIKGLTDSGYTVPTDIQRQSLGLSLRGQDILGAAKTGSGKTLAFLIPVLEILYCKQWTRLDGTGALIITPTRELAYQIFETLRKVGVHHDFSAGLIIGGKDLKFEKSRMDQVNIIICTPGRLLQHMDENPLFDCRNLQVLVLDEADRILDLGFQQTMNNIIQNIPKERQTLLFSATQTKSVQDLARLSLKDPMYVSVHEHAAHSTPESLAQSYLVCELEEKLTVLYSFIRNHLKHKILVFMSSCKQVKFMYEAFCQLRTGASLLALYGSLHQMRRMAIYEEFCRKSRVVMFATDIAARGLDFPAVNWVVQLDCPEDAETYIHRAGRTARLEKSGESLLILLPSEKDAMLQRLENRKIPIKEIKVNPEKLQNPNRKLEAFLAQSPDLKESAQRAFVSYVKSVFLMKDKKVFDVKALDTDAYARSLGLAVPPRIRFLQRKLQQEKNKKDQRTESNPDIFSSDDSEDDDVLKSKKRNHEIVNKIAQQEKNKKDQWTESNPDIFSLDDSEDDDVLKLKRRNHEIVNEIAPLTEEDLVKPESRKKSQPLTKAAVAKKFLRKKIQVNKKVVFDESGEVVLDPKSQKMSALAQEYDGEDVGGIDIEKAKAVMKEEDQYDKQRFREKIRAKHREEKKKAKLKKEQEAEQDDFSSSDESTPDLSWLPDPDKIYGERGSDEESVEFYKKEDDPVNPSESGSDTQEKGNKNVDRSPKRTKRKLKKQIGKKVKKPRSGEEESFATLDTGLSLQEDEELALKFLRSSRT